jgi:CMP-N,N'-diacetyllegionaminic acid synthase
MLVYALIPARSGSKGLPDKNVLPVNGHPLIAYSIAFGRKLDIDRVLVSTDSEEYQAIAHRYGAECPYLRGSLASSDVAMEEDILADLHSNLPKHGIRLPDIWVWLKPTCPFRDLKAVQHGIKLLEQNDELESVRIITEADARLHVVNDQGYLEPLLPTWDPSRSKMRRSEFPKTYFPFNLEIFRHKGWEERGSLFMGRKIAPIVLPKVTGLDVDDLDGFEIIRALIESRPQPQLLKNYVHL